MICLTSVNVWSSTFITVAPFLNFSLISPASPAVQKTLFTLLVHMRQTVSFRVISVRLHVKGQPLYMAALHYTHYNGL